MLSIVAANARWQGTLQTEGSLVIHGHVEGTIQAAHDVTILEGATVRADISAQQVIVRGSVQGRIDARGRLEIHPGGEVIGEVSAPSLVVHEGARLSGKLKMGATESTDSAPSPGGYR
jgi:cytoskeletal protein CcmA (bactofilin family)